MDSINKNQEEHNHEDLQGNEAIEKIKELAKTCFFCTRPSSAASTGTRPMSVQQIDDNGSIWFLSANDSYKNQDIAADPGVKLYFQESPHSGFLYFEGQATISGDRAKIKELWNPLLKTWFTEGEDDPRISVIKVTPATGYYWDNKSGKAVAAIKVMIGALTGKTLDDSIEGHIQL